MTTTPTLGEFRDFFLGTYDKRTPEIESTDVIPPDLLKEAAELGAYRLTIPTELGGCGLEMTDYLPYLEVAAMSSGSGRLLVHHTNGLWRPIAWFGNKLQRALIPRIAVGDVVPAFALTEKTGGTGRDIHSRARLAGNTWLISGEKHLITFADRADWFILVAATDDRKAKDSLTAFLIPRDTPGFEIDTSQSMMGCHGTGHAFLRYTDMPVPDSQRLGQVGQGLEVALSFLDYSRVSLSNSMVGIAQRALDEAVSFAQRRTTFGEPIASRQAIQGHLAEMHADVNAGRHLVRHAAERFQANESFTTEAATAKLFCLNMVGRVTDRSLRVHGGFGYTTEAPIERMYRDARSFWFEEGTAEIQQLVVARAVLKAG
jgi:alkylation response protein AidB-like acyl-CoA dehydrogenase